MQAIFEQVSQAISKACSQAFSDNIESCLIKASITPSTQEKFGHFQCNAAMRLTKLLQRPPREIAAVIQSHLDTSLFEQSDVAGPGFLNLWLNPSIIAHYNQFQLQHPKLGLELNRKPQHIIVDFSSPNIAKEMHVGHLRSTIIGDCIANTFEYLGDQVLRLNHVGDWGTAFGMLIIYLKQNHPDILNGNQETDLSELVQWYKAAKQCFDDDLSFKKQAQQQVVALQQGEASAKAAWKVICDISRIGFEKIYHILNVKLTERGESYYNDRLADTIEELNKKGLITLSDNAKCVFLEGFVNREKQPLPLMVQKSDGGFNYASTDLAALYHRAQVEKADRIIYVTDSGQSLHFKMVFAAAKKAAFYDAQTTRVEHAGFGLVLGEDGKKFKTRSGETVRLQALLDEAVSRAQTILTDRNPDTNPQQQINAATTLGIGAVKYADLSCQRLSDYKFSFDRMLQFEGNTAAFILYSYVRVRSIQRKTGIDINQLNINLLKLNHPSEISLALQLSTFGQTILKLADQLTPHILTDYLFQTAQKFNAFFRDCRVEGTAEQNSRLLLCELSARVIQQGLQLLGIQTLEKM